MKLSNTSLTNPWVKEELMKIRKHNFEPNYNENTIYQNVQVVTNIMLKEKFIALNTYIGSKSII